MKFIIDAQLPRRLAMLLQQSGHDAVHTLDLPLGNRTPDLVINQMSIQEQRVVVTKDSDFVDTLLLRREPWKLILVSTGNIHNDHLMQLFRANLHRLVDGLVDLDFIEINSREVIFHE